MSQAWAVARQMISEGLRMKLAGVFCLLLGLCVLGLPFSITGDASITGAVQSFLSYALSSAGFLLALLTIFLSRSLSDEFVHRQMFLVVTKPIARWQIILGKWAGICLLDAAFLGFTGLAVYGGVQYIKASYRPSVSPGVGGPTGNAVESDLRTLNNEVLTARHVRRVTLPDFTKPAEQEFQRRLEEGRYDDVPNFDEAQEKKALTGKYEWRWRIVPPLNGRVFQFDNILCDRSPDSEIQLRYKTEVSGYPPDEIFRSVWRFGDAYKGAAVYDRATRHIVGRFHTIRVPADAVAEDGTLTVRFSNHNPNPNEKTWPNMIEFRQTDGPEILFVVGSFHWNLVRLLILVMCRLMFLAAVAILMATVFSFPVACLASITVYCLAIIRKFLMEALAFHNVRGASMFDSWKEFFVQTVAILFDVIQWIIPDFAKYDAVETLVNGQNVGLVWVLQGVSELVLLKTAVVLGLAMLLFYRREVAEVSF